MRENQVMSSARAAQQRGFSLNVIGAMRKAA
jgi:hypothetical protein